MSNRPFDRGAAAARRGQPLKSNPFNHPDRQTGKSMDWERKASEWDEGWKSVRGSSLRKLSNQLK